MFLGRLSMKQKEPIWYFLRTDLALGFVCKSSRGLFLRDVVDSLNFPHKPGALKGIFGRVMASVSSGLGRLPARQLCAADVVKTPNQHLRDFRSLNVGGLSKWVRVQKPTDKFGTRYAQHPSCRLGPYAP